MRCAAICIFSDDCFSSFQPDTHQLRERFHRDIRKLSHTVLPPFQFLPDNLTSQVYNISYIFVNGSKMWRDCREGSIVWRKNAEYVKKVLWFREKIRWVLWHRNLKFLKFGVFTMLKCVKSPIKWRKRSESPMIQREISKARGIITRFILVKLHKEQ